MAAPQRAETRSGSGAQPVQNGGLPQRPIKPFISTTYQEAWEKEGRVGDKRKAEMFYTLDQLLYKQEEAV